MVEEYKTVRETVQRGDLYRLMPPENGSEQSVTETVSRDGDQVVTFAFLHSSTELFPFPRIFLRGLNEEANYSISALDGRLDAGTPTKASGSYWMHHGVDIDLRGNFQAAAFTLTRTAQ